jgi:lysylphosphatidylglycerol synthetase-like protein (DUF2156 family)
MSDAATTAAQSNRGGARRPPQWLTVTIAVFFGLFYAYDIWGGVGNLVGLNLAAQGLDTQLSGFGWMVLLIGVLIPVAAFGLAVWLGRTRGAGARAVLLLAGLCLVAALSLDIFMFGLGSLIV